MKSHKTKTKENYDYFWSTLIPRWAGSKFNRERVSDFLNDTKLTSDFFKGILAVDAGCGYGRNTYALGVLGSEVVGFDISTAGIKWAKSREPGHMSNVHLLRGDLLHPPLRRIFDFAIAWGTLHHTPNPRMSFHQTARLLKPGGTLWMMVYEKANPFKAIFTFFERWIFNQLPPEKKFHLCGRLLIKNKFFGKVLPLFIEAVDARPKSHLPTTGALWDRSDFFLQTGLYDALTNVSKQISLTEAQRWFIENGFEKVVHTNPPVVERSDLQLWGKKHRWFRRVMYGEYGHLHMRGIKRKA